MKERRTSTASVLVPINAKVPSWVFRSPGAKVSLYRMDGGHSAWRLDLKCTQSNFARKGMVVIRPFGSRGFLSFLKPGVAYAVADPKGNFIFSRHFCRVCYENTGWFARDSNRRKVILHKGKEETIYQFHCFRCGFRWKVSFPNSNGNGNGHSRNHGAVRQFHRR